MKAALPRNPLHRLGCVHPLARFSGQHKSSPRLPRGKVFILLVFRAETVINFDLIAIPRHDGSRYRKSAAAIALSLPVE